MAKCALIGNPISHSKSPALFKAAYGEGPHTYTLLEAPTCKEAMHRFVEEGFTGTNVTSPFKDEVMEYISLPDRISSILGSANTVISCNGTLHSYNTDYWGVRNTLLAAAASISTHPNAAMAVDFPAECPAEPVAGSPLENIKTMVIGAGGAGKAAALAAKDLGMDVWFANRSSLTAKPFAEKIGVEYIPLEMIPSLFDSARVIIYNLSMEIEQLKNVPLKGKTVFEANYAHPNLAGKCPETYIDGRHWLYNQAVPAFRLFTGQEPDTIAMKRAIGL